MKPETLHEQSAVTRDDAALTDASAEAALRRELGLRYGLFIGLKQALELLTGRGEAVH
jgi:hypothetical protein